MIFKNRYEREEREGELEKKVWKEFYEVIPTDNLKVEASLDGSTDHTRIDIHVSFVVKDEDLIYF